MGDGEDGGLFVPEDSVLVDFMILKAHWGT